LENIHGTLPYHVGGFEQSKILEKPEQNVVVGAPVDQQGELARLGALAERAGREQQSLVDQVLKNSKDEKDHVTSPDDSRAKALENQNKIFSEKETQLSGQSMWGLRILYVVPMYDFKQYRHTETMMDSGRDLCEAGAKVSMIIQTTVEIIESMRKTFEQRLYCANPAGSFDFEIENYDPEVKHRLSHKHRKVMYDRLDDYDIFIYSEDDMHVRPFHVALFLEETRILENAFPDMYSKDYTGTRYIISNIRWESAFDVEDLKEKRAANERLMKIKTLDDSSRVYWENFMKQYGVTEVAAGLGPYVTMKTFHTAMWILTKKQMLALQELCHFDEPECPYEHCALRLWVSMNQFTQSTKKGACGFTRVFPLHLTDAFAVHHLPDQNWKRKLWGSEKRKTYDNIIGDKQFSEMMWQKAKTKGIQARSL